MKYSSFSKSSEPSIANVVGVPNEVSLSSKRLILNSVVSLIKSLFKSIKLLEPYLFNRAFII